MTKLEKCKYTGGFEAVNIFSSSEKRLTLPFSLTWGDTTPASCIAVNVYNTRFAGIFFALSESAFSITVESDEYAGLNFWQGITAYRLGEFKTLETMEWGDCVFSYEREAVGHQLHIESPGYDPPVFQGSTTISDVVFSGETSIKTRNGFFLSKPKEYDEIQTLLFALTCNGVGAEAPEISDLSIEGIFTI